MRNKSDDKTQFVLQALVKIKEACEDKKVKSGIIDNLSGVIFLAQKIRKYQDPKTIGFFGAQKRGKSSLINQLLRCDLLPTSPIPMSSVVIKVKHDSQHKPGKYTVMVINANGAIDTNIVPLESAQTLLKEFGSHKGVSDEVDTIEVTSNFTASKILEKGGVLVDTPGAEVAFSSNDAQGKNNDDTARALNILQSTHIVIFVERADVMENFNSKYFFTEYLKPMRPLSVINWKDAYTLDPKNQIIDPNIIEAKKQAEMREIMLKAFAVSLDRTICVSSKEAQVAKKNNDKEMLDRSNLPELENRINRELENLSPEVGLITCLQELQKILSQIDDKRLSQEIFAQAQRPFFVLLSKCKDNEKLPQIARYIYDKYRL